MLIQPAKSVTLVIGETSKPGTSPAPISTSKSMLPRRQGATIRHYDTIISVLEKHSVYTDGSRVILRPGTNEAFEYEDDLYASVEDGLELFIVPNREGQVGWDAIKAPALRPRVVAVPVVAADEPAPSTLGPSASVGADEYPKTLRDSISDRPDRLVEHQTEEIVARHEGFTVEVPAPPAE